ncbi:uncharacterized protein LOC119365392 [Triticum dicoccoides]|uniref:uncharacterized protein LOC119365392 n=1 Tax=Triticum dicoccoides TaxID=85692 RepID=UPI00188E7D33|nr:uncharacterized protein LOC119365392 [Triticum dicoccoides]
MCFFSRLNLLRYDLLLNLVLDEAVESERRSAADLMLRVLQNNPDMWLQVVHILQNYQNLNTMFYKCWPSFFISWVHMSSRKKNPKEKLHLAMRFSSLELVMCCVCLVAFYS